MNEAPMTRPGEIAGHPKLVLRYPTDADAIAALLPPGLETVGEPVVQIGIYCVPVYGEPEYGVSTKVAASYDGVDGQYCLGIGIDQEAAIFVSRETNGQPKFPCSVRFFRLGDEVHAACTHQGRTFLTFDGTVTSDGTVIGEESGDESRVGDQFADDEWWIKVSRAVGGIEGAYDFAPHVVRVHSEGVVTHVEPLTGALVLTDSAWDPYTELLPMRGPVTAELLTARHTARTITLAGPIDPVGFWPHADTIGGSRWPGHRGGPRPTKIAHR